MKKILVIQAELKELFNYGSPHKIIFKKNKTIVKDLRILSRKQTYDYLSEKQIPYKFLLEEWEFDNSEETQVLFANDGNPLRPVHIIESGVQKEKGIHALFQSERILILKISHNKHLFEITKNTINDKGKIFTEVLKIGKFNIFNDIIKQTPDNFHNVIYEVEKYCNSDRSKTIIYGNPSWNKEGMNNEDKQGNSRNN